MDCIQRVRMIRPFFQQKPLEIEGLYQQIISKIQIQVLHRYLAHVFAMQAALH